MHAALILLLLTSCAAVASLERGSARSFLPEISGLSETLRESSGELESFKADARDRSPADPDVYTLEWIYHDPANAVSLQYPDGKRVRYDFDAMGRLWQVRDWNGRTTTYEYDSLGRLEWTLRANGTKRHVTYDAADQIQSIAETDADDQVISTITYPGPDAYWGNGQVRREHILPVLAGGGSSLSPPAATYEATNGR